MPIYEYICTACEHAFEKRVASSQTRVRCPSCDSARVARQFSIDDSRVTPAHTVNDGVDFVPTRPFYLFAQHFSAIAAAGPTTATPSTM